MELIAASRIVRAQQAIAAARPYVAKMGVVVGHVADTPDARDHPLFRSPESVRRVAVMLITADRGLAGGYNISVLREAERLLREHQAAGREATVVVAGRKGENYFRYRHLPILASITGVSERPRYEDARRLVGLVMGPFQEGALDQIQLVYTRFVSLGSQIVTVRQLAPMEEPSPAAPERGRSAAGASAGGSGAGGSATGGGGVTGHKTDFEFEPEPAEILDRLLPRWLEAEVLAAMLESAASEQASRQRAMKAATDNADDLIKTLRRVMNRARQDSITTEIMEIVGGAEALRQAGIETGAVYNEFFESAAERA